MSDLGRFEELARTARADRPPQVDVVNGVIRRVRAARQRESVGPLWPLAVAVSAASAAAFVLAMQAWESARDPLTELFSSVGMVLQ